MSGSLEHLLDFTLDMREQRRRHYEADLGARECAIHASCEELARRERAFATDVHAMIRRSVQRANHHLATRPERCEFCELPDFSISPWRPAHANCHLIAYALRVNGQEVGETLVIELSNDGMIEALLWPFRLTAHRHRVARIDFGWSPIPLYSFDAGKADELLVLYLTAITQRWQIGRDHADPVADDV